ncbi:MAG: ATP-binding protein [Ruthenibacterium sp.]
MTSSELLLAQLHSLAIFRGILQNNVMKKLTALLSASAADVCAAVDAYGAFAAALYAHTDSFSDYLLKAVLDDENVYVHACCEGGDISAQLIDGLAQELLFLQELSLFDASELCCALRGAGYSGYLPAWGTRPHDFDAVYRARIADLPRQGYGIFAKYHVFTVRDGRFVPVKHPDPQSLSSLSGYERERSKILANTRALLEGRPAANALLYGDAGTGKSSTVKAVANALCGEGLRLIEVKKNQLYQIPDLVDSLSHNPLKFILFIDDLSFSANDDDFAALKAILEGSVSSRGSNLVVYATSNRRHLVKEMFSDRAGDEVHLADTMQEVMSLSARFALTVTFSRPDKELYCHIVQHLALLYGLDMPPDMLLQKAEAHAIRSGGRSPRVAKQFIEQLKSEGTPC